MVKKKSKPETQGKDSATHSSVASDSGPPSVTGLLYSLL